jgi:CubicO group peptidase (beta-lactamase class C family)
MNTVLSKYQQRSTFKNLKFCFVILISFAASPSYSQSLSPKQLAEEFDKLLSEQFKPGETGGVALVAQKGQVIYKKGFGMASLELNVPMQSDMVFRIGSITKQFTAICILQLMEKGQLTLQDEITKFIPDYPTHNNKITIQHLLTHTSGIVNLTSLPKFSDIKAKDVQLTEIIDFFKNEPLQFVPGTHWSYSNSGYILLGYIIEKVSGLTYAKYLEENIFKPCKMNNSYRGNNNQLIRNRANGYHQGSSGIENAGYINMFIPHAAGSILSSVDDLFKWHQSLYSYTLVKKETLEKAFEKAKLNDGKSTEYGFGWLLRNIQGSPTIEHGGGIEGYLTEAIYLPREDVFVVLFSNSTSKSPQFIAAKMCALAIGKPYAYTEIQLEEAILQGHTGVYENEEGFQLRVEKKGKQMFAEKTNGLKNEIKAYEKDKYFYDDYFSTLTFNRNSDNSIATIETNERFGGFDTWRKSAKPFHTKTEIKVPDDLLTRYAGEYQLNPNLILAITKEDSKLFGEATGQPKLELFAETENKFFLKVMDIQIEFLSGDNGQVSKLILHQGDKKTEAKKIK